MASRSMKNESGNVFYRIEGSGDETIVFTHGATMDHGMFTHQIARFKKNYRVIAWDVPAHGKSRPYSGFSIKRATVDLKRILDREEVRNAHLVGQSMGGYISQALVLDYPDRVQSVTAVDASPLKIAYYPWSDRLLLKLTPGILRLYPYGFLVKTIANQVASTAESRRYALEALQRLSKYEIAAIMKAVYAGLVEYSNSRGSPLSCPVLIVYGDRDRSEKVIGYCRRWAAEDDLPLAVIPNAAHNSNMDNPEEFNRVLAEFLAEIA